MRAVFAALRRYRVVVVVREVEDAAMGPPRDGRRGSDHVFLDVGHEERIGVQAVDLRIYVLDQNRVVVRQIILHVDHVDFIARSQLLLKVRII